MEFKEVKSEGFEEVTTGFEIVGQLYDIEPSRLYPESSFAISLKTEEGLKKFWGNKILKDKLNGLNLATVKIVYNGKKKSETGKNEYHDWTVFEGKE